MKQEMQRLLESSLPEGILFEGIVSVRAVFESGRRKILRLYYDREKVRKTPKEYRFLQAKSREKGFSIELLPRETLDEMAVGSSHGGVLLLCGERELPFFQKEALPKKGFFVLLDGVEDPYNFGYALRSLYAAGADGVLLPKRNWMSAAGIVCRASAGASEKLALYLGEELSACMDLAKKRGYRIVGTAMEQSLSLYEADLRRPLLLLIGGERRGISGGLLDKCDQTVRIDYGREFPAALSAASAAAVLGFEVLRQNRKT